MIPINPAPMYVLKTAAVLLGLSAAAGNANEEQKNGFWPDGAYCISDRTKAFKYLHNKQEVIVGWGLSEPNRDFKGPVYWLSISPENKSFTLLLEKPTQICLHASGYRNKVHFDNMPSYSGSPQDNRDPLTHNEPTYTPLSNKFPCRSREKALADLTQRYDLKIQWQGAIENKKGDGLEGVVEFLVNKNSGKWAFLLSTPDAKTACTLASGNDWTQGTKNTL